MDDGTAADAPPEQLPAPAWLRAAIGRGPTCVLVLDDATRVVQVVGATDPLLAAPRTAVVGAALRDAVVPQDAAALERALEHALGGSGPAVLQGRVAFARDERVLDLVVATDPEQPGGLVVTATDVTDSSRAARELARRDVVDPLTGLGTRGVLLSAARHHTTYGTGTAALVVVDLARFRLVNEAHGPARGDQVLAAVGRRLAADAGHHDTVARLGGDEFAVLLHDLADGHRGLEAAAERIHAVVARPVALEGATLQVQAWVGAQALRPGDDADRGLQQAVSAVADARAQRRWVVVADATLRRRAATRADLLADLTDAIEGGQISMRYQPIVDPCDGAVVSVEALARWQHPRLGLVGPADFVPLAEESGAVLALGRVALDASLDARDALEAAWPQAPTVAVNVSPLQLTEGDWVGTVQDLLAARGRDATGLVFELTESVATEEADIVAALRATGARIVVDDFGTGFSSLSRLQRLGVDGLKVDQSFTSRLVEDEEGAALVAAILALANALKLEATVEGVETLAQRDTLVAMGATRCQGHLWHPPLLLDELLALQGRSHPVPEPTAG